MALEHTMSKPPPVDAGSAGTILLVDDHHSILKVTRRMLGRLGWSVVEADRGYRALELFSEAGAGIDLVILDLGLPDIDGMQVLAEMRRRRPDARVIVSSGANPGATGDNDGPVRPDGYLDKPYTLATLRETLKTALPRAG